MQALKIKVRVENNRISADLPAEVPDGEAEFVVLYEEQPAGIMEQARRRHLEALLSRVRQHSRIGRAKTSTARSPKSAQVGGIEGCACILIAASSST